MDMNFIFIGGAGRSGTTLLQKLLLRHDSINGGPEFYFTKDIMQLYQKMHKSTIENPILKLNDKDYNQKFKDFYSGFFSNLFTHKTIYISEKTPTNIESAGTLLKLFEESYFINIVRDGRAVVNSHLEVKRRAKAKGKNLVEIGLIKTSQYWVGCVSSANNILEAEQKRFINISYEELILDPNKTIKLILSKIGVDSSIDFLNKKDNEDIAYVNDIWYTKKMLNQKINPKRINSWQNELNFLQIFILNSIMYKQLVECNYKISRIYFYFNEIYRFLFVNWKMRLKTNKMILPIINIRRKFL